MVDSGCELLPHPVGRRERPGRPWLARHPAARAGVRRGRRPRRALSLRQRAGRREEHPGAHQCRGVDTGERRREYQRAVADERGGRAAGGAVPTGRRSGGTIAVAVRPAAPAQQSADGTIDGNVYTLTATDPAGPVALTSKAALATIYLRATTAKQPGPAMEHRSGEGQPWQAIKTSRGGADVYVSSLPATGQYACGDRTSREPGSRSCWPRSGRRSACGSRSVGRVWPSPRRPAWCSPPACWASRWLPGLAWS